ncbi:hypothetical protein PHYPSEUDO_011542 [Phytophthora pseudosyringae]|uniref:Uncharacterized protein n=1 Tax=Phytophthora pseudosyringae TaxID=221518 RepID=A0A8T1VBM1_9STRA|nr:hypothetical protein PHYPSEUDO_011542 [Phytophthora pseudosyringae]
MVKNRRCTYATRREKAKELRDEVGRLQLNLKALKAQYLNSNRILNRPTNFRGPADRPSQLSYGERMQQLQIAKAQSMLPRSLGAYRTHPLYSRIHLGQDWGQRLETLMSIREAKLGDAYDFVMARNDHADLAQPRCSNDMFETSEGDLCSVWFETTQFAGVQSVQQVFDALTFYFDNTEMIIAEHLGDVAMRDDYDCIGGGVVNSRMVVTNSEGTAIEASTLVVSRLFDGDNRFGGEVCGVVAVDSIDEDELYPYETSERVRLDSSGAIIVTASREAVGASSQTAASEDASLVVTMHRASFMKLYRPAFALSAVAELNMHQRLARSGDFMIKAVRQIVYGVQ